MARVSVEGVQRKWRPRQDSNLELPLRRRRIYPVNRRGRQGAPLYKKRPEGTSELTAQAFPRVWEPLLEPERPCALYSEGPSLFWPRMRLSICPSVC